MFDRLIRREPGMARRTSRADLSARGRWENEGGARPETSPATTAVVAARVDVEPPAESASIALDTRQDELMTLASSDGRPPTRPQRVLEWQWVGLGAILIIAVIATWIVIKGVSWTAVGVGLALGVLLLVGASPVLAAGLLRGQEERAARKSARLERQGGRGR
jgi:hypothetical protein